MKIVHIYKDYYPVLGGIENHIRELAEAQVSAGHDVTVLVCDPGPRTRTETHNGVRVVKAGRLGTVASMPVSLTQPLIVARLRPDVAHVQSPYPLGEMASWLLGRAKATVISYQSDVVRQAGWLRLYRPLLRRVLGSADRIIASSQRYLESSPFLAEVRDKCVVVPLSVDHLRFRPPVAPYTGPPTLLFVGRLRYYKGLDALLTAMTRLPGVALKVVGTGPMMGSWQSLAEQLGLRSRVQFLGDVPDGELPIQYHEADCFVLPANARAEAFGRVLLEAMASGLPCITTEVGTGTSWVVRNGVTGVVVPPRDTFALAEAVGHLLSNADLRREMGDAGRARVESEFTQARMVAGVQAVYDEALGACV
jgi:rhamnosyl/mannosyltransferase